MGANGMMGRGRERGREGEDKSFAAVVKSHSLRPLCPSPSLRSSRTCGN